MIEQMASRRQPADSHDVISIQGARENNLKNYRRQPPTSSPRSLTGESAGTA